MKLKYNIIAIFAAALYACVPNEADFAEPVRPDSKSATFPVVFHARTASTRTTLTGTTLNWSVGDQIGVFVRRNSDDLQIQANQPLTVENLVETGAFTGDMPIRHVSSALATFYAYYPASQGHLDNDYIIRGEIPVCQSDNFIGAYDYMIATPIVDDYEESTDASPYLCGAVLDFPREGQVTTTLKIDFPAMTAANFALHGTYPSEHINSISISTEGITSDNIYLAGEFTLDVRSVHNRPQLTTYGRSKHVFVSPETPISLENSVSIYLTVFASGTVPAGLRISIETDHGQMEWTTKSAISFDRGTVCNLQLPATWDTDWTSQIYLSQYGTANCYVVMPNDAAFNDEYCFDATVKGNGIDYSNTSDYNGGLQSCSAAIDPTTIADAVLVWEAVHRHTSSATANRNVIYPTSTSDDLPTKRIRYADGKVYFRPGSEEGNAVIAIRDSEGNILWSWHIWVAADAQKIYSGEAITTDMRMMTRNLGAKNNTAGEHFNNSGMHYQWGRKDPFVPLSNNATINSGTARGDGIVAWSTRIQLTDEFNQRDGALAYSIAHPNQLINSPSASAPNDWYTTNKAVSVCNYLWGGGYHYRKIGGVTSSQINEVAPSKTMFDPCPIGYRMPLVGAFGFQRTYGTTNVSNEKEDGIHSYNQTRWLYSDTNGNGFFCSPEDPSTNMKGVTYVQDDGTRIYYPATGQLQGGNSQKWTGADAECRYWCATVYGPEGASTGDADCNYHACTTWMKIQTVQPANNYHRESLRPVRCQFEQFFHENYTE